MLEIMTVPLGPLEQNSRIVYCPQRKSALAIDPGAEGDKLIELVEGKGLRLEQIWLTHSHFDHCGAVAPLLRRFKCPLLAHQAEQEFRALAEMLSGHFGMPAGVFENCPEPTQYLSGGEELVFADQRFKVLFTPGHSPGHLCFHQPDLQLLWAGDVIFQGSIGRTDLPGGSLEILLRSIKEQILVLDPATRIMSGHGPDSTVGQELSTNPFLRAD